MMPLETSDNHAFKIIASVSFSIITLIVFILGLLIINDLYLGTLAIPNISVPEIHGIIDGVIWYFLFVSILISAFVMAIYTIIYKCYLNDKLDYMSRFLKPFAYFVFIDILGIVLSYTISIMIGITSNIPLIGSTTDNILFSPQNLIPITEKLVSWGAGTVLFVCYIALIVQVHGLLVKNQKNTLTT